MDSHMLLAGVSLTVVVVLVARMFYTTVRHRYSTDRSGRRFQSNARANAPGQRWPPRPLRPIEEAFRQLRRRAKPRGI